MIDIMDQWAISKKDQEIADLKAELACHADIERKLMEKNRELKKALGEIENYMYPELISQKSEDYKKGYKQGAELTKLRIAAIARKAREE